MHEDERGGVQLQRAFNDLSWIDRDVIDLATSLRFIRDQRILAVEIQDVKFLYFPVG